MKKIELRAVIVSLVGSALIIGQPLATVYGDEVVVEVKSNSAVFTGADFPADATVLGRDFVKPRLTADVQIKAACGVLDRAVPGISKSFKLEIIPQEDERDVYELEQVGEKIVFRGSTGVAICSAFNRYLMDFCKCDVSWCGDQLNVPSPLPKVPKKIRERTPSKYRAYMNYCTFSYSAPWWDWERWQQEIDFMALKGINMPLAARGLEGVWYNTLLKFGFTDDEARAFLVGPTFQAWQWMTNIEGYGGPLPKSWIKAHIELGQRIVRREYELGMMPIQQAFSGYVPRLFKEKFPESNILAKHGWCGFEGTAEIEPLDPMFRKFGKAFLRENIRLFGAGHNYAADPFHESRPPRTDAEYMASVAHNILGVMRSVDSQATWIMQGWTPHEGVATAVPNGDLVMLDLTGSRYRTKDNFWGHDTVIGSLHNFGGRINMHGDLAENCRNRMMTARKAAPNIVGMGLFMEGIIHNPVFFNNQLDMIWREEGIDPLEWVHNYAERRYGAKNASAEKAWGILLETIYSRGTSGIESSSIIAARPALDCRKSGPNAGFGMRYDPQDVVSALDLLLGESSKLGKAEGYRFDVMDLCRQVLSNLGQELHNDVRMAYSTKDLPAFRQASMRFLEMLADVDRLLATRDEYSFHKWIRDARSWATNDSERKLYEKNAAMLVTHWGPEGNPSIFDYAWREWSGLISGYYLGRWTEFHDYLEKTLVDGIEYNDTLPGMKDKQPLNSTPILEKLTRWEIDWINKEHDVLSGPQGDTIAIAQELLAKYRPDIERVYSEENQKAVAAFKKQYQNTSTGNLIGTVDYRKNNGVDTIDLSEQLSGEGRYRFQFNTQRGGAYIDKLRVLLNGSPVWTQERRLSMRKTTFPAIAEFELEAYAFGSKYELEVTSSKMSYFEPMINVRMKALLDRYSNFSAPITVIEEPVVENDISRIGSWSYATVNRTRKILGFDVSRIVQDTGIYVAEFTYEDGRHKLGIHAVRLFAGETMIAEDVHDGEAGLKNLNNNYELVIKKPFDGSVILKVELNTIGGDSSVGSIRLQRQLDSNK